MYVINNTLWRQFASFPVKSYVYSNYIFTTSFRITWATIMVVVVAGAVLI